MRIINIDRDSIPCGFQYYSMSYQFFDVPCSFGIEFPRSLVKDCPDAIPFENTPEFLFLDKNIISVNFYSSKDDPDSLFYINFTAIIMNHVVTFKIYYSIGLNFVCIDKEMEMLINTYHFNLEITIRYGIVEVDGDTLNKKSCWYITVTEDAPDTLS